MKHSRKTSAIIGCIALIIVLSVCIQQYMNKPERHVKEFLGQYGWSGNVASANLEKWCRIFQEDLHGEVSQIDAAQHALNLPTVDFSSPPTGSALFRVNSLVWEGTKLPDDGRFDYAIFVFFDTKSKEVQGAFLYETTYSNDNAAIQIYPITTDRMSVLSPSAHAR